MKKNCFVICCFLIWCAPDTLNAQVLRESYLYQSLDYYFITDQYDKALRVLDTLDKRYGLSRINLNYAVKVAVKFNRKNLTERLLREYSKDFDFGKYIDFTESDIQEWLADSTFTFKKYFGKKWNRILCDGSTDKRFMENLKTDYYNELFSMFSVDQFIRANAVSKATLFEVDSLNLDQFVDFLLKYQDTQPAFSRYNNQTVNAMLRHIGKQRFIKLEKAGIFKKLLLSGTLSNEEYALLKDYLNIDELYFPPYDAFINEDWKLVNIATKQQLIQMDQHRAQVGLLPLEYCAFCIRKNLSVPRELKYAPPIETLIHFNE